MLTRADDQDPDGGNTFLSILSFFPPFPTVLRAIRSGFDPDAFGFGGGANSVCTFSPNSCRRVDSLLVRRDEVSAADGYR